VLQHVTAFTLHNYPSLHWIIIIIIIIIMLPNQLPLTTLDVCKDTTLCKDHAQHPATAGMTLSFGKSCTFGLLCFVDTANLLCLQGSAIPLL
jgi:hypothetical protein